MEKPSVHTLQPFMRHFVDSSKMQALQAGKTTRAVSPARSLPRELKWCPKCAIDQRSRLGFAVWLRSHNLPGVEVCRRHCCRLQRVTWNRSALVLVPKEANSTDEESVDSKSMWYAKSAAKLLHQSCPIVPFSYVQSAFRSAVHRRYRGVAAKVGASLAASLSELERDIACLLPARPNPAPSGRSIMGASVLLKELQRGSLAVNPVLAIYLAQVCAPDGVSSILKEAARLHAASAPVESRAQRKSREAKERRIRLRAKRLRQRRIAEKARQEKAAKEKSRAVRSDGKRGTLLAAGSTVTQAL